MDEDWAWIESFQKSNDLSAFRKIFEKYKSLVVNLAFRCVKERSAAEDIAQDVFIKIYEKKLKASTGVKFSTWLYRVTFNAGIDFVRKRKFISHSLDEDDAKEVADPAPSLPSKELEEKELKEKLRQEIDRLPEKLKYPLLLFQFENLSYEEIASILGVSKKAVERRIYHAKQCLRGVLAGWFVESVEKKGGLQS